MRHFETLGCALAAYAAFSVGGVRAAVTWTGGAGTEDTKTSTSANWDGGNLADDWHFYRESAGKTVTFDGKYALTSDGDNYLWIGDSEPDDRVFFDGSGQPNCVVWTATEDGKGIEGITGGMRIADMANQSGALRILKGTYDVSSLRIARNDNGGAAGAVAAKGYLQLDGGTLKLSQPVDHVVSKGGGEGTFIVNGGHLMLQGHLYIADKGGHGEMVANGGTFELYGETSVAANGGTGAMTIGSGDASAPVSYALNNNATFNLTYNNETGGSIGTLTLKKGGTLRANYVRTDDRETSTIVFDGGTLEKYGTATDRFIGQNPNWDNGSKRSDGVSVQVSVNGGAISIPAGFDLPFDGTFTGAGVLAKTGEGTLNLSHAAISGFGGGFAVDAGTLVLDYRNAGFLKAVGADGRVIFDFSSITATSSGTIDLSGLTLAEDQTLEDVLAGAPYVLAGGLAMAKFDIDGSSVTYEIGISPDVATARIGSTYYLWLADAVAAARDGDTVVLLKDIAEHSFTASADITVDLGGHTITRWECGRYVIEGNCVVTNGTIVAQERWEALNRDPMFDVMRTAHLTLADVNVGDGSGREVYWPVYCEPDLPMPRTGWIMSASTVELGDDGNPNPSYMPEKVIDGDSKTRWATLVGEQIDKLPAEEQPQWLQIDFGTTVAGIKKLAIEWESACAKDLNVISSIDGETWVTNIVSRGEAAPPDGVKNVVRCYVADEAFDARYLRVLCLDRPGRYGYSIWEINVYQESALTGSCVIDGGTWHTCGLVSGSNPANNPSVCEIRGGTFYLRRWQNVEPTYSQAVPVFSGGRYSLDPQEAAHGRLADGCVVLHVPSDTETPYYVVAESELPDTKFKVGSYWYADQATAESAYVAQVGGNGFTSLADAARAAQDGDVISVIADVDAVVETVSVTTDVTIEGNGHTVKVRTPYVAETGYVAKDFTREVAGVFYIAPGADVEIRNLHVMGGGEDAFEGWEAIRNQGILRLDDVTVTRSNGGVRNGIFTDGRATSRSQMYMTNCRIVRNCRYCAGGVLNDWESVLVMDRSSLSENRSLNSGGGGGACENRGIVYVNNCVVCNNASTEVGGAFNEYVGAHNGKLYLMNTTLSGNFTSDFPQTGGGIGLRGDNSSGSFYAINSIICNNYKYVDDGSGQAESSDMALVIKGGERRAELPTYNGLYYNVYGSFITDGYTEGVNYWLEETGNVVLSEETARSVFNAYYPSVRVYQDERYTKIDVDGAQLVSKDDGSLDAKLARYAPVKAKADGGVAVLGEDGVYTYFDPTDWKSGVVRMSYKPIAGGEMTALSTNLTAAAETFLVTNFYERADGRNSPLVSEANVGVVGASAVPDEPIAFWTVKLAKQPSNGTADGITLYGDTYKENTQITVSANPAFACEFIGWYRVVAGQEDELVSTDAIYTFALTDNVALYPVFSDPMPVVSYEVTANQSGEDADFPIRVTTAWLDEYVADVDHGDADAVKGKLNGIDPVTGLKLWQEYVLGIAPGDHGARIWINSPHLADAGKIRFRSNDLTLRQDTGFTVKYRLDAKLKGATDFTKGGSLSTDAAIDIDVTGADPTGCYRIAIVFVPDGFATSEECVLTVNTAGLLKVVSALEKQVVAVPWAGFSPTNNPLISAAALVKTANLTAGDRLYVYDGDEDLYRAWQVKQNGEWDPLAIYALDGIGRVSSTSSGSPEETSVPRGTAAWLERQSVSAPIFLCGQYDESSVTTPLAAGWNLVGDPGLDGCDASLIEPAEGDRIVIPTGAEPKNCTYEDGSWGYVTNVTATVRGREFVVPTRVTTDLEVPAGTGFWYISAEGGASLSWPIGAE